MNSPNTAGERRMLLASAMGNLIIGKPQVTADVFRVASAYSKGGPKFFTGKLFPRVKQ